MVLFFHYGTYVLLWLIKEGTYPTYALMSLHWLPFLMLAGWVFGFFVPNMLKKDKSLARFPLFAAYKGRTGLLFPRFQNSGK